jgi:hypothetical protein
MKRGRLCRRGLHDDWWPRNGNGGFQCHPCKNEYRRDWRRDNPHKDRQYDLQKLYGLTVADFEVLFQLQNYKCAICAEPMARPYVDHDKQAHEVRGLLCLWCNSGLGFFKDDTGRLKNAITYLNR